MRSHRSLDRSRTAAVSDAIGALVASRLLAPEDVAVELCEFDRDGATLVVEDYGSGQPYLFIHGIGMGRGALFNLAREFDERVIAVDLPGYGAAPEPEQTPTIAEHADLLAAWLRCAGVADICAIGHSMGSQVAVELAARHPDLVAAVVLLGPTVDSSARTIRAQAGYLVGEALREKRILGMWRGIREYMRAGPNLLEKMRVAVDHAPESAYPRVFCRALVLRGERDRLAPRRWCEQIVELIADSEFSEIQGHGHGTVIGDGAPVARAIKEFWARRAACEQIRRI